MRLNNYVFIGFLIVASVTGGCLVATKPMSSQQQYRVAQNDHTLLFPPDLPDDNFAADDGGQTFGSPNNPQTIIQPLTLYAAIARAIKYNQDHRLRQLEEALAEQQLDLSRYDLLPRLLASAGTSRRSNLNASVSQSLTTGIRSTEASTSADRSTYNSDLTLSWNLLNFGLSYYTARQESDRRLIALERRRTVTHNLMQEVILAFWRSLTQQTLQAEINTVLNTAEVALEETRTIEAERLSDPAETL